MSSAGRSICLFLWLGETNWFVNGKYNHKYSIRIVILSHSTLMLTAINLTFNHQYEEKEQTVSIHHRKEHWSPEHHQGPSAQRPRTELYCVEDLKAYFNVQTAQDALMKTFPHSPCFKPICSVPFLKNAFHKCINISKSALIRCLAQNTSVLIKSLNSIRKFNS